MNSASPKFNVILERAAKRKGGKAALQSLLSSPLANTRLSKKPDAYFLAHMTRCIFYAGFVWKIVDNKWPDFEKTFLGFNSELLLRLSDEQWERFSSNTSIIRNHAKIKSVRNNAQFVLEIAAAHQSFGRFLSEWPSSNQVGLLELLKKQGSRLGGMSGQYFLRFCGKDCFVLSRDVVLCLQDTGCDINNAPNSKRALQKIQQVFNHWHDETQLSYQHLSQIMAYSIGSNNTQ